MWNPFDPQIFLFSGYRIPTLEYLRSPVFGFRYSVFGTAA
jgi:hypothetical protein